MPTPKSVMITRTGVVNRIKKVIKPTKMSRISKRGKVDHQKKKQAEKKKKQRTIDFDKDVCLCILFSTEIGVEGTSSASKNLAEFNSSKP